MTIFMVDSNAEALERIRGIVSDLGIDGDVRAFQSSLEALAAARETVVDVAILEVDLMELDGLDLGEYLKEMHPMVNLIYVTADRLYTGSMGFDRKHWYRMRHHFPRIDEDNYDRFAALVIADLRSGPLHDAALNGGDMLLVGEPDPLHMTSEQRAQQRLRPIKIGGHGQ